MFGSTAAAPAVHDASAPDRGFEVHVKVDAAVDDGYLPPIWRFFGADEPNYASMKDGRKLLAALGGLRPGAVYFRAHNLLNSGDGTAAFKWGSTDLYTERGGRPVYDWTTVDRIIDGYLERGIHPYLQLGFMPEALSTAPPGTPYRHSWRPGFSYDAIVTGWAYPPKDYDRWRELIYRWTRHNVERYGRAEVERWYFEVWNEANGSYWKGSPEEFYKLHDYAVDGVRRALPTARVGGPDAAGAGGAFMDGFIRHVTSGRNYATGRIGTPTDFLAFHAKGRPEFVDGHVRMGIATHLQEVDRGFAKVAAAGPLAEKPIIIGESDPEGCAACPGPQNAYRNGSMYSSYTAASFARIWELARRRGVRLDGALSWSFEFEDQPWFAGYRQLASNGVELAVLNVFRMFAMLGDRRLRATSDAQTPLSVAVREGVRARPDVGVLATRSTDHRIAVLLWHYHDDDVAGPTARVEVTLDGMSDREARASLRRVDDAHGNAYAAWLRTGSPLHPDERQYAGLEEASRMLPTAVPLHRSTDGARTIRVDLPRRGVALLLVDPA